MAAEDAVVDVMMKIVMTGVDVGLKISGAGAKAIGLSMYALAKSIREKQLSGKKLTPGEVAFTNLIKSGEEIHSVWINKDELENFSQIAKKIGISFVAIQNGDELSKGKGFIHKLENGDKIEFADEFKDKVSISYRCSDEVRMAHILQMFNTFNPSMTVVNDNEKEVADIKDEVEEFIKENGVENEYPPEVADYEEVKNEQSRASEINSMNPESETINPLQTVSAESSKEAEQTALCFTFFGWNEMPTKEEFINSYKKYVLSNNINVEEPNFVTALYEQGCKVIDKNASQVPECFAFFQFKEQPTVEELKSAYNKVIRSRGSDDVKTNDMYKAALNKLEKSESVRTTLQAKKELRNINESGKEVLEKVAEKTQGITRH